MSVRRTIVLGALAALCWCGSIAHGGAPLGMPIATLEEQQWGAELGYGMGESDWEASGLAVQTPNAGSPTYAAEFIDLNGFQTRMVLGTLAYGICDNWDVFARFGVSDVRDNLAVHTAPPSGAPQRLSLDADYGLAWGIGTRATFCHWGPWRFGGLAQATWFNPKESDFTSSDPDVANTMFVGRAEIDYWQAQFALAAVYQIDTLNFWAGPFLQFVEGDLQRSGRVLLSGTDTGGFRSSANIENNAQLGIHMGINWEASRRLDCQIEGQFANDSWFLAAGAVVRPQQLFARP